MKFGVRLRKLRIDHGLTQSQLAEKIDTSKSNISKYESNTIEPNLNTLLLISKYFDVSVDFLLGNEKEYSSPSLTSADWSIISKKYPDAIRISSEIRDLINYYEELSLKDQRWIMGQMIDLIKKADEENAAIPKAQ